MLEYKHNCVIGEDGIYKTFVQVLLEPDENGQEQEKIQGYSLAEGESLIDSAAPTMRYYAGREGYISPRWNGVEWTEGATLEELAAWNEEHPAPPLPQIQPTPQEDADALLVDHEYRLTLLELGVN